MSKLISSAVSYSSPHPGKFQKCPTLEYGTEGMGGVNVEALN